MAEGMFSDLLAQLLYSFLYFNSVYVCFVSFQKIDGCNKMTCMKCRTYFCWLCNELLSKANPYAHYNSKNTNCFNRLFEGVVTDNWQDEEDDEEIEWWLDDI